MAERLARYNKDYRDAMPPIQALISGYAGPYLWESNLTGWTYANNRGLSNTLYKHRDLTKLLVANTPIDITILGWAEDRDRLREELKKNAFLQAVFYDHSNPHLLAQIPCLITFDKSDDTTSGHLIPPSTNLCFQSQYKPIVNVLTANSSVLLVNLLRNLDTSKPVDDSDASLIGLEILYWLQQLVAIDCPEELQRLKLERSEVERELARALSPQDYLNLRVNIGKIEGEMVETLIEIEKSISVLRQGKTRGAGDLKKLKQHQKTWRGCHVALSYFQGFFAPESLPSSRGPISRSLDFPVFPGEKATTANPHEVSKRRVVKNVIGNIFGKKPNP